GEQARTSATTQRDHERQRRKRAELESEFVQMFIGILGHDLRNPLNAVMMAATLIKKSPNAEPSRVDRILSSGRRMATMVEQLLDLTRSRLAGGIPVEKQPIDLSEVISQAVDELRVAYPGREIQW